MANQATTTYKVTGTRKAVNDLWSTLQKMEVNSKNVWLYQLAEHYGIDSFDRLTKGAMITVEGYFKPEEWQDGEGVKHNRVVLVANKFYETPDKEEETPQEEKKTSKKKAK